MRLIKLTVCLFLCAVLLLPFVKVENVAAYSDGFTLIGDVSIPFAEYMPGTYFTKNGLACTCHGNVAVNCVANGDGCNCLRYANIGGETVDLRAVQCIGFARYCFFRLFGFIDLPEDNPVLYYNAGTLNYGEVTPEAVKQLFSLLKPGAHIRFKLAWSEHSVILLSQNDLGFTVYQANSGGNGTPQEDCIVSTKSYTWESFASYAFRGVVFAHMPTNYPEKFEYSDMPYQPTEKTSGIYKTTANLKLREGASTETAWLDTLALGTEIYVAEILGDWGRVIYNGAEGYISLNYAAFVKELPLLLSNTEGIYAQNGYIFGLTLDTAPDDLQAMFDTATVSTEEELLKTGALINVIEGDVSYTLTAVINGDVNGDGALSTADCATIQGLLMGDNLKTHFALAADFNGDGMQTTADYRKLKQALNSST